MAGRIRGDKLRLFPMRRSLLRLIIPLVFLLFWSACPCLAQTPTIPEVGDCSAVFIMTSEGWWLNVRRDGSAEYGFGALPERVRVSRHVFDFTQIYEKARASLLTESRNAEAAYKTATFFRAGNSAARAYYLKDPGWVPALFSTARTNSLEPENEIEKQWHETIDDFWKKSPPVSLR